MVAETMKHEQCERGNEGSDGQRGHEQPDPERRRCVPQLDGMGTGRQRDTPHKMVGRMATETLNNDQIDTCSMASPPGCEMQRPPLHRTASSSDLQSGNLTIFPNALAEESAQLPLP
jgi:hypothetical protein